MKQSAAKKAIRSRKRKKEMSSISSSDSAETGGRETVPFRPALVGVETTVKPLAASRSSRKRKKSPLPESSRARFPEPANPRAARAAGVKTTAKIWSAEKMVGKRSRRSPPLASEDVASSKDENFLCTALCDWLAGLPSCNENRTVKVLAGLEECSECDEEDVGDTVCIDLRGRYVENAKELLWDEFDRLCHPPRQGHLNVRVGCKKHGVGEGKLKQAIMDVLKQDDSIQIDLDCEDSIISIKLDGREDYHALHKSLVGDSPALYGDESFSLNLDYDEDNSSEVSSRKIPDPLSRFDKKLTERGATQTESIWAVMDKYNKASLCTIACDLLFGFPKPQNQRLDKKMRKKIMEGFEKCYGCNRDKYIKSDLVDLRGMYVEDAIEFLVQHLDSRTRGCVDVVVGCVVHGVGDGKLKRAVMELLKLDETIESEGPIIPIKLDGHKIYKSLRDDFVHKFLSHSSDDESEESIGLDSEDEEGFLTIACDLQFGCSKSPDECLDEEMKGKEIAEELQPKFIDETMEDSLRLKICGKSVDYVIKLLIMQLSFLSLPQPPIPCCTDLLYGCKLRMHDEGKLKQAVIQLLEHDINDIEEEDGDSIISIKLVGRENYGKELLKRFEVIVARRREISTLSSGTCMLLV